MFRQHRVHGATGAACHRAVSQPRLGPLFVPIGRVLLTCYLLASLVFAGSIAEQVWARGVHLTPDAWSQHLALERLGFTDHHHHVDIETDPEHAGLALASLAFNGLPTITSDSGVFGFFTWSTTLGAVGLILLVTFAPARRLHIVELPIWPGRSVDPPEPPPKSTLPVNP